MKKPPVNPYDVLIDAFLTAFQKSPKFHLVADDPSAMGLIQLQTMKSMELLSLERMYKQKLLPYLNELEAQNRKHAKLSKYARLIPIDSTVKADIDEWVRVGYVVLFHKYEAYHTTLLALLDKRFSEAIGDSISLSDHVKNRYGFKLEGQWRLDPIVWKVNYVSNSVKHYDGLPKPYPNSPSMVPARFRDIPLDRPLSIHPKELYEDITHIRDYISPLQTTLLGVQSLRIAERVMNQEAMLKADVKNKVDIIGKLVTLRATIERAMALLGKDIA